MASDCWLGYFNQALAIPVDTAGISNPALLASPIPGRRATLSASARADFAFPAIAGLRMVGVDELHLMDGAAPSITFAFSNLAVGGSELGAPTFAPTLTRGYRTKAWVLPAALSEARYLRVVFTNCAAVGNVWCSPVVNPKYGIEVGAGRQPIDLSVVTESSMSGAATALRRPMLRQVDIRFGAVNDQDFMALDDMVTEIGSFGPVMLVPGFGDERRDRDIMHGRLVNLAAETHIAPALMAWPFQIRQLK